MSELNHRLLERFELVDVDALTRPIPEMDELRERKRAMVISRLILLTLSLTNHWLVLQIMELPDKVTIRDQMQQQGNQYQTRRLNRRQLLTNVVKFAII